MAEFSSSDDEALVSASQQVEEDLGLLSTGEDSFIPPSQVARSDKSCLQSPDDVSNFDLILSDISDDEDVSTRFGTPVSDADLTSFMDKDIPETTRKTVMWAVNLFEVWRKQRNGRLLKQSVASCVDLISSDLVHLPDKQLQTALARFIVEVRKVDGSPYPPKTVRQLILLLQMHLNNHHRPVHLLSDPKFSSLQNVVDRLMKKRAEEGLGLQTRRAEVISVQKEDHLWKMGLLGDSSPSILLDTMVFLLGLNFALRSGEEHRMLSRDQLVLVKDVEQPYLEYTEKISKNNQRGLKDYNVERKVVRAYAHVSDPNRCLVNLYSKYIRLCPDVAVNGPVYLQALRKPKADVWYSAMPVGRNTLAKTVSRLCSQAGFEGYLFFLVSCCSYKL
jgi:hypothetical protein